MRRISALMTVLALAAVSTPASAQLATFDDLAGCTPTSTTRVLIDNGYVGFNWDNFYVANGANTYADYPSAPGYANGVITPHCMALNGFGRASEISSSSAFIFNGGYFTSAFDDDLTVRIAGFSGSSELFTTTLTLNTSTPHLLDVAWEGVDRVRFEAGNNAPGSQFVFDNFRFNNVTDPSIVPEPATILLVGGGLGLLGLVGMRRRKITS